MKQVIGTTVGFFLGGPVGALRGFSAGSAWDASDKAKKQMKVAGAAQTRMENTQRRQIADADSQRKQLLQEGSRVMGRRRGPLTSYSGVA